MKSGQYWLSNSDKMSEVASVRKNVGREAGRRKGMNKRKKMNWTWKMEEYTVPTLNEMWKINSTFNK